MKKPILAILLLALALPGSVAALDTRELVALAAMPLAVAAVADLADVPTSDLIDVVTSMNRAAVPPAQFVEVVRYVPVALVDTSEPRFVTYVSTQVDQGVRGDALALAMADRMRTSYGVTEINVVSPRSFVAEAFTPEVLVTREQRVTFDPLALVAMPLAVAAVSELTDVPAGDLFSLIALMNQAKVPPAQFVEVVRYVPVALVDRSEPQFVRYVTTEFDRGVIGSALAVSIGDRIRLLGVDEINVVSPPVFTRFERALFVPPVVVTRLRSDHPHGGPPGQLKKQVGVQTGAEIVHGDARPRQSVVSRVVDDDRPRPVKVKKQDRGGRSKVEPRVVERSSPPKHVAAPKHEGGHGKSGGASANPGKGKGKGKGKGQ